VATTTQLIVPSAPAPEKKRDVLRRLIRAAEGLKNGIIFCNRKTEVAKLHRSLVRHGFSAIALHGDMDQRARMKALDAFRDGEIKLLVASDVAARGLDIPDVSHVFNFDVPHHAEDYVHRIGRTGRAGRSGTAIMIASSADTRSLAAIEKLIGQKIPWQGSAAPAPDAPARAAAAPRNIAQPRQPQSTPRNLSQPRQPQPAPRSTPQFGSNPPIPRPVPAQPAEPGLQLPAFLLRPVRLKAT
jgi:superfamily II DNA/RNA helicase